MVGLWHGQAPGHRRTREPDLGLTPAELEAGIAKLKRERNTVILAHYYQESEIQDFADYVGDSLQLSQAAAKTEADVIGFCGVHFMAETAKILNPGQGRRDSGSRRAARSRTDAPRRCSASGSSNSPAHTVVSYINCSAEVKALSDVICTSSNAVKIVKALAGQKVVFAPDRHLGAFVAKQAERPTWCTWQGTCIVHETFSEKRLLALMVQHPDAEVIAHPECHEGILRHAAFIASTSGLIDRAVKSPKQAFIVATRGASCTRCSRPRPTSC